MLKNSFKKKLKEVKIFVHSNVESFYLLLNFDIYFLMITSINSKLN